MAKQSLSLKISFDPAYTEVVKFVGWLGVAHPVKREDIAALHAKYGRERLDKVSAELIEYDTEKKLLKLKSSIHGLCRSLLGPKSEEWDEFYSTVTNPPPNPYKNLAVIEVAKPPTPITPEPVRQVDPPQIDPSRPHCGKSRTDLKALLDLCRYEIEKYGPETATHLEAIRILHEVQAELDSRQVRRLVAPPELTHDEMLGRLDGKALANLIEEFHAGIARFGLECPEGRQLERDLKSATAERKKRKSLETPDNLSVELEIELLRTTHGRELRQLLLNEHDNAREYPAGHELHDEALRRMDLLEGEMRKRKQKIPERPAEAAPVG